MKKNKIFLGLVLLFTIGFASASISLNELSETYNLGDEIPLIVTLSPTSNEGWFTVELICGKSSIVLEKSIGKSFYVREEQTRSLKIPLIKDYIGNATGNCKLKASINSEATSTPSFKISNGIDIKTTLDKENYNPGEDVEVTIGAIKDNGEPLKGFIKISGITKVSKEIEKGVMSFEFQISENFKSGKYNLNVFAYDELDGKILNSDNGSISLKVNQVPKIIQTSFAELEATPGEEFKISLEILDQAGIKMEGLINLTIISPKNEEIVKEVSSGKTFNLELPTNSTIGNWKIISTYENLSVEKSFTVNGVQKVNLELTDSLLIIKNIGNLVYNKSIEVSIGEKIKTIELDLQPGEIRNFNLNAPTGEYAVKVQSEESSIEKNVLLTGKAISIKDSSQINVFSRYPFIWVFLIILLVGTGIVFLKNGGKSHKIKERTLLKKLNKKEKNPKIVKQSNLIEPTKEIKTTGAQSSLVLSGEKEVASIIALKIENLSSLGTNAKKELLEILKIAKDSKGMIERKDNCIMIIYSSLTTKTFNNEIIASRVGSQLLQLLEAYNRKFEEKISFNIGIHSGEIISSLENNKLKYTSLGNTVILSKKISDLAKGKLLVSDSIRNKIIRDLKVDQFTIVGKNQIYSVSKVNDRTANTEKLKDLLKRMDK